MNFKIGDKVTLTEKLAFHDQLIYWDKKTGIVMNVENDG